MASINVSNTGTAPVATNAITRDGQTENMQLVNFADPSTGTGASVTAAGTPGANAVAIQGTGAAGVVPISGSVSVSSVPSIPAGTNVIGHVLVDSIPSLPAGSNVIGTVTTSNGDGVNGVGTGQFIPIADASAAVIAPAAATTAIIAGVAGKQIRITGFEFISNGSGTVQFVHGVGNTAVTGQYPVTAQAGISRGAGIGAIWILPAGDGLSVITTSTATAQGSISYTIY